MKTATTDPFAVDDAADESPEVPADAGSNAEAAAADDTSEFDFVRLPNGSVVAVPKSSVHEAPATSVQSIPANSLVEVPEQQYYVHLADGSVERVKESDLPIRSNGTNAVMGHWQRDNNVYEVIGIYPVEDTVKGSN